MWWIYMTLLAAEPGPGPAHPAPDTLVTAPLAPTDCSGEACLARGPLTLDAETVARLAAQASTSAAHEDGETRAAAARARALDQRFLPRVDLQARYTRIAEEEGGSIDPGIPGVTVTIPGAQPNQWHFGVGVSLPVSDWFLRSDKASEAGRRAAAASTWKAAAARRRAALDATLAYWDRVRIGRALAVSNQTIDDAKARLAEADKRVRAEVASTADLELAKVRVAEAELQQATLASTQELVEAQLRALLDLPVAATLTIVDDAAATPEAAPASAAPATSAADLAALIADAWRDRPEPRALNEAEAAYRAELGLAEVKRLPRFDVVANAQVVNPNPRAFPQKDAFSATWDVSAVVSWNVNGLWETAPAADEVRAKVLALDADRRALDDGLRLEIAAALRVLRDATAKEQSSRAMLAAATEGHRVRTRLYALGKATAVEVAEAETQLERARLGLVDAAIDRNVGEARLRYAVGR
ncbi:MAG: TolC family protein [Deltaproteobacteria bacterium]|nr:TolC family protein [Deltaproteobacteria bacterium]